MHQTTNGAQTVFQGLVARKILVAEDVEFNQYIARQMLESWGMEVTVVNNGLEVMELLKNQIFDCILMDIQMPEMGGIETAIYIRKLLDPQKASIPIIALTANALKGDKEKYIEAGMTDVLSKPFREVDLYTMISQTILPNPGPRFIKDPDKSEQPTNQTGSGQKLYDLSMVESLSGGDKTFIKKMVALFIETIPSNVDALKLALENKDWDQVSKMAHKLKSSIDSMGIKTLKTEIREVEANAKKRESLDRIPALVKKVDQHISNCIVELGDELLP